MFAVALRRAWSLEELTITSLKKQYGYSEDEGYAFDSIEQQEWFTKASTLISG